MAEIKLKIASVVIGSGDGGGSGVAPYYADLPDKPSINGETLSGDMTSEDLGLASSGQAVPSGGTTGQVLAKKSNADNDVQWVNQESGGTEVEANPTGEATEILESIGINGVKYSIKESHNVFGYYNSGDGKFYKEGSYETEIIGEEDKIYIDLATNTMLRYDVAGSVYEPIGDSEVDKRVNGVVKESYYKRTSANVDEYAEYGTNYNSSWRYLDLSVRKGETVFYKAVGHYASNPIQPVSFVDSNGILKLKIEYSSQNQICEGVYTVPSDGVFTINMRKDSSGWDDAYLYVIRASSERKVSGAVNNGKYKKTESENNSYANYDIVGNQNWRYIDLSVRKDETVFYRSVGHSGIVQPVSFADSNGILRMLIQAPSSTTTYENTYTAPDNGVFTVNVRHDDGGWDDAYLYIMRSSSRGGASNESVVQLADFVDGMQGRDGVRVSKASMENADVINLDEIFPHMNKFGNKLQLTAKVTTMGTLQFRFGPMPASGYIEAYGYHLLTIDDTNIKLYKAIESDILTDTVPHGMTITDYISVNLNCLADGTMKVEVNTNDNELNSTGRFSCVLDKWDYGVGHIRVISNQCILTDVQLSVTNEMFRCPFWMFGASQEGLSDIRYAGQLMKMGYLNVLDNARSGRTSEYLIEDLRRALVFGCPKYLFYTFSNDGLDQNVYEQRVNTIIDIADSYGIKLIVKIVAVVSTGEDGVKELAKRNFILNLLSENKIYRVFDFGKAVSADPTDPNELYDDYLDSALIHPKNAKAAAAVAMQFLADVPEIMQYGKQSNDSLVIGDTQGTAFEGSRGKAIEDKIPSNASSSNKMVTASDLNGKVGKVANAQENNFASFDANGGIKDSTYKAADFATAAQGTKADNAIPMPTGTDGQILEKDSNETSGVKWVQKPQDGKSALQIYNETYGTNLDEAQFIDVLKQNYPMEYVAYDATAAAQTIGTGFASIGTLAADSTTAGKMYLMPNDGTTPTGTILFVTVQTGTSTYAWYKLGDLDVPSNVLTENDIVNDLTTGGVDKPASAETVKTIAETTMELVEGLNILDPSTIIVGEYIKADTIHNTISKEPIPSGSTYLYGHTDFISLPNEGLRCNGVSSVSGSRRSTFLFSSNNIESFICWLNSGSVFDPSDYPTAKYVIYNLAPVPDGYTPETYYAVYKGQTFPNGNPIPYTPTQLLQKPQSFESGEKINEVPIDNTNLVEPNENSLAKAVDVKNSIDGINTKLSGIDYSESNVELVTSGEGQNVYSGLVAVGRWIDSIHGAYLLIPVDGVKKIKFLAGEKSTNASDVGFAIGTFSGEPNATLEGFSSVYYRRYAISSTTRQVEYEVVIPQGYTGLYAAISIWGSAGVTTSNFYCKTISGDTLDDIIQEKIDNSETSVKPSTSTSSVGNINIHCAKEHTFSDGTPPILEWFLVEEPMGKFYYTKDFNTKTLLFTFANSMYYQFGILENGDIIAVMLADSLDDSTPQSDSKRTNPYVWKADENWSVQHEVVFGDYDATNASDASDIANITGLKPCGWLSNKGFRMLPDGSAMFGEYTRPTVETCNVWRITGDALDPENWHVVKTFYPIGGDGFTGYKHVHHIGVDHYTGTVYCTTGDVDAYAQIWYTLDYGDTWTQISKNSSLNNGQQFRLCFMTFTKDYVLWATDTPGTSTGDAKHVVYRGERDENGILDSSTLEMICNVYDGVGNISSYGQAYLQEYDALFLFDRQDGGGVQSDFLPLYVVDVSTGVKHKVADLTGYTQRIGFRTKFKEWYPVNGIIRVGFGYGTDYCNNNKICGNQQFVTTSNRGKTTVNNLCLIVKKDGDNWTCRFSTYYV